MKRVSFKVAKYLKEVGYPQNLNEGTVFYAENGLMDKYDSELYELFDPMFCVCPYAMEVWLWLWREKKMFLAPLYKSIGRTQIDIINDIVYLGTLDTHDDPEEAIIAAIEYLVDNNLIK